MDRAACLEVRRLGKCLVILSTLPFREDQGYNRWLIEGNRNVLLG